MTLIRMHDIRENDVHESAGMSNIPWEYEYGFQKQTDLQDTQSDILDELYYYGSETNNEGVLDGLSPDRDGMFFTPVRVRRNGKEITVKYTRERLIKLANDLLLDAAVEVSIAIQREHIRSGPHVEVTYEFCKEAKLVDCVLIDGDAYPLNQILDLRGIQSIGRMDWVDAD